MRAFLHFLWTYWSGLHLFGLRVIGDVPSHDLSFVAGVFEHLKDDCEKFHIRNNLKVMPNQTAGRTQMLKVRHSPILILVVNGDILYVCQKPFLMFKLFYNHFRSFMYVIFAYSIDRGNLSLWHIR